MLVHGQVGVRSYTDEAIADPRVLALAAKVRHEAREYDSYPAAFPGGVRIRTTDGRTLEADLPHQRGGPENPMTADEVRAKFRENAALALGDEAVEALEEAVLTLEERDDVRGLLRGDRDDRYCVSITERTELVGAIRDWVDREVVPVASDFEHADEFPVDLVAQMRELGLFGVTIPEQYGGLGLGLDVYALIVIELSRGWTTLSGIVNGSFIASWMLRHHGTEQQKDRLLPRIASGEVRASFSMTEPHAGSDVQSIRMTATRDGDDYVLQRPEDVGHERLALGDRDAAREDRPGRRPAAHRHDRVRDREGARGLRAARPDDPDARA